MCATGNADGRGRGPLLQTNMVAGMARSCNRSYPPTFACSCCARFRWSFSVGSVCDA
jgi:hypothetical protein